MNDVYNTVSSHDTSLNIHRGLIDSNIATLSTHDTSLNDVYNTVYVYDNSINALNSSVITNTTDITNLKTTSGILNSSFTNVYGTTNTLLSLNQRQDTSINDLDTRLGAFENVMSVDSNNIIANNITNKKLALEPSRSIIDHTDVSEGASIYEQNLKCYRQYNGEFWENMKTVDYSRLRSLSWSQFGTNFNSTDVSDNYDGLGSIATSSDGTVLAMSVYNTSTYDSAISVYKWNGNNLEQIGINRNVGTYVPLGTYEHKILTLSADGSELFFGVPEASINGDDYAGYALFIQDISNWQPYDISLNGIASNEFAGQNVAMSYDGNRIAYSAPQREENMNDNGIVITLEKNGSVWTSIGDISGSTALERNGAGIAFNRYGDVLAIGRDNGSYTNASNLSSVQVFRYDNGWISYGSEINAEENADSFGYSVALNDDGTKLLIGANNFNNGGINRGKVYLYEFLGGDWSLSYNIVGENNDDRLGRSLAINFDGTIICAGAPGGNYVTTYQKRNESWIKISDITGASQFGDRLALSKDGHILHIGSAIQVQSYSLI